MKIVIDTNVVISGVFFGGNPRRVLEAIVDGRIDAVATKDIIEEYMENDLFLSIKSLHVVFSEEEAGEIGVPYASPEEEYEERLNYLENEYEDELAYMFKDYMM